MSSYQKFRAESYILVTDQFLVSLEQRVSAYMSLSLCLLFGFINQKWSSDEIDKAATKLINAYLAEW